MNKLNIYPQKPHKPYLTKFIQTIIIIINEKPSNPHNPPISL